MNEVVFIGDDFTGASDCMSTYARNHWSSSLLVDPAMALSTAKELDAPGIPTDLRSLSPAEGRAEIARVWPVIAALDRRIIHYKTCSTFDSAPQTGSIGAHVDEIAGRFAPDVIAVIGGQPSLGRYSAFGNLFAKSLDGCVYRIDQHPVMSVHPVTPMAEANLMTHLARQGLVGLQEAFLPELKNTGMLVQKLQKGPVFFDVVSDEDLQCIASALQKAGGRQLLIGSSSVAELLIKNTSLPVKSFTRAEPQSQNLFVFSGSRSSSTAAQIEASASYEKLVLGAESLESDVSVAKAVNLLKGGTPVLAYLSPNEEYKTSPDRLVDLCVTFVTKVLKNADVGYLGLAGGDTSSRICASLEFTALDFWRQLTLGTCVCTTRHVMPELADMRVMLKGGQMGTLDVFDRFAALRAE